MSSAGSPFKGLCLKLARLRVTVELVHCSLIGSARLLLLILFCVGVECGLLIVDLLVSYDGFNRILFFSVKAADFDREVEDVADGRFLCFFLIRFRDGNIFFCILESGKKLVALVKDEKLKKRQRKLSHTSAGDFVVSEPEKISKKKSELSNVFQESDSWE